MTKRRISAGEVVTHILESHGIQHVFGLPGTALLPILKAMKGRQIRYITTRHEQVAALMAVGYARASGKVGVCMGSRGPAATNMSMGIHDAHQGSYPVLALLGQVSRSHLGRVALQEIDLVDFFRPITKWAVEIPHPDRVAELFERALVVSQLGRQGPVMVSVPTDISLGDTLEASPCVADAPKPFASEDVLRQVVELLHRARQPFIMAGGGILSSKASAALARFSNAVAIPVAASYGRNDLLPRSDPMFIGHMGLGAADDAVNYGKGADVVLAIGTKLAELSTMGYTIPTPEARVIHIDIDPAALGVVRIPSPGIVADAAASLDVMTRLIPDVTRADEPRLRQRRATVAQLRASIETTWQLPVADFRETPIHPAQVIQEIQAMLPPDHYLITCDAGSFSRWVMRFLRLEIPGSWMVPTSGGMGFGFAAAMGAQLALPDHLVLNLAGDGGFLMTCQDLETAVRERLPVVSVVFNNNCYGTVKDTQRSMYGEDVVGSDYGNPDFGALARAFGAFGERVERASVIGPALRRALDFAQRQRLPAVVEVLIDPQCLAPAKQTIA